MATETPATLRHGAHDAPPVTLGLGVSPALEGIARGLVDLKLALDRFSRDDDAGQPFLNDWFDSRTGTCPHPLKQSCVPHMS
ncbi:hypothetical protein PPH41_02040 [Burkholderia gladioli]|nr:hypothetical protein [Burkholderia gladioli]